MLFNSFSFALFLPIVFAIYWGCRPKNRWAVLLIASYYFYMSWNIKYALLILFATVVSFFGAILIEKADRDKNKKIALGMATFTLISVLIAYKYLGFLFDILNSILSCFTIRISDIHLIHFILPVGISFYTFQTLSYVIDVYRGDVKAEHDFGKYATFVSFFPQLVAGPIERTNSLMPQLKKYGPFNEKKALEGIILMIVGYYKKIVVADTLSLYVDNVYNTPFEHNGGSLLLATFFFSIQIYCDFSGYSDIAIGTAKLFGIELSTNFNSPYFAKSIKEFWSRWHISLSKWFRDYVYIPLGGNRTSRFRTSINVLFTFLLSGLWHGANWTFVLWGGCHGIAQVIENYIPKPSEKHSILNSLRRILTYLFCMLAWVFFRANSITESIYILSNMFSGIANPLLYFKLAIGGVGIPGNIRFVYLIILIFILFIIDNINYKYGIIKWIFDRSNASRWIYCIALLVIIILFSQKDIAAEFVYFQF